MIRMIVAHDQNLAIGRQGVLPWPRLPKDMTRFKNLTMNTTVVMGSKTYNSIGHALSGRHNIVISRTLKQLPDAQVVAGKELVLLLAQTQDMWIIGGSEIYTIFLPHTQELHVTAIQTTVDGADTFFPPYQDRFTLVEQSPLITQSGLQYRFQQFKARA